MPDRFRKKRCLFEQYAGQSQLNLFNAMDWTGVAVATNTVKQLKHNIPGISQTKQKNGDWILSQLVFESNFTLLSCLIGADILALWQYFPCGRERHHLPGTPGKYVDSG